MRTLVDILPASAARFGDKPALLIKPTFRTRVWSYRDLGEAVPRIGRVLADAGIAKGDRVLIWAVNRPEWALAFFGALQAGAVLVPLDVRSLADFASRVATRTRAVAVLASEQTAEAARGLGLPVHLIEELPERARSCEPLPPVALEPHDLAEVVFTSGTTGDPKGAMLTHGNILSNGLAATQIFPVGPRQRLISILPLSHMFEQLAGLIAVLLAGASVVYPTSRQPAVLVRTFREFKVSMVLITPAVVRALLSAIERKADASGRRALFERLHQLAARLPMPLRPLLFFSVHRGFGGKLRYIVSGGAALDPAVGHRWQNMGVAMLQGYGTTECAPAVTFNRLGRQKMATVGTALPGVEVRVAEDGEVLVRGPNVFAGYWEDPEATSAVLRDGWYHTGDLGELDAEGFLTLRGRKKDLIVLADGQNVYPEDGEFTLTKDPRVKDATVLGLQRPGEEVHVHAVLLLEDPSVAREVVHDANRALDGRQQIRGHSVWPDDDFPRTHTQKVKKREVLARLLDAARTDAGAAAPRGNPGGDDAGGGGEPVATSDVQRLVAQLAPAGSVRPEARLSADLGLDSLARVELLGIIEEELGAYIDDATLDPETTVAQLEGMVEAARDAKRETGIYGWPLHPLIRSVGLMAQQLLLWPLARLFYRVRIVGAEKLNGLRGPVMFAPNHCLRWDNGIILTSIPLSWRWRLAVAAAADDVFGNRLNGIFSAFLANAFPLAREGAIRRSLELLGARLDRRFSVLIYPEGKLTVGGPMQPFKSGTGLIAVEGATPVVPMKLKVHRMSGILDRRGKGDPLRGDVTVVFGQPLYFGATTDANEATKRIEAAVAAL
ncbi:MAG: AMP-binding protein [Candidatus Limnocylindria bacterium]